MDAPRWLADEMLGRLARYLRFVGCDTAYVRGADDSELVRIAEREGRVLLTRDRQLSGRTPRALLLRSPELAEQWRAVRAAFPGLPIEVAFSRCSLCNGRLRPEGPDAPGTEGDAVPAAVRRAGRAVYACSDCGHRYWEGSHTATVRRRIAAWEREVPR